MELNDNEFDATFRRRVFDADPQFEDAAWDKMERKLKRRDRIVFVKRSALVLLFLLAGVWGYFFLDTSPDKAQRFVKLKKEHAVVPVDTSERIMTPPVQEILASNKDMVKRTVLKQPLKQPEPLFAAEQPELHGTAIAALNLPVINGLADTLRLSSRPLKDVNASSVPGASSVVKEIKIKRNLPVSLAISAGPEFNSASSVVGGDPGFSAGLTLGFGISKKLDLQAGVRYSIKKYNSGPGVKYSFPGVSAWMQNNLTGLDATCDVLEIPVLASYTVLKRGPNSINLNAGVSSYLMLKEDYALKYNSAYGQSSWDLQKKNANRHLLSVVDLSATYFVKVQHTNLKLGLEPFVKIPLSGVGEGNINLKSSGISLKIRYDLDKKSN